MGALFSPQQPATPVIPAPVPTLGDAAAQQAASSTRARLAAAAGRDSTILTANRDAFAPAGGKTLLGAG